MFDALKNILRGGKSSPGRVSTEDREQRIHVAAGVVLLEVAHVDDDCSPEEMEHIVATLRDRFELSDDCVNDLLELAHADREQALDLWQFTSHINKHFSLDEKQALMEDVWRIIYMDGKLDEHEDHFAHKLANLFHLSHSQLIDAKLKARNQVTRG
jgi:uncharacterized tellurite resistance protein B-like protein